MLRILRRLEVGPEMFDEADRLSRCRWWYLRTSPEGSRGRIAPSLGPGCMNVAIFKVRELAVQALTQNYCVPCGYGRAVCRI